MLDDKQSIFVERMKNINPKIKILGRYIKAIEHIEVECLICGHHWNPTPNKLLMGRGCPECAKTIRAIKQTKTHEKFIAEVSKIHPNIIVCTPYKKSTHRVELKCSVCDNRWTAYPYNILSGRGCPKCKSIETGNRCRKPKEKFIAELKECNPYVRILGDYINCYTNIKTECVLCGNIWEPVPKVLLRGSGCPICNLSKGERKIKEYLDNLNCSFVYQKTYEGLIGTGGFSLSYDFFIPSYNLLIEYQGEQHQKPVDFKGYGKKYAEKTFYIQKEHDKRKRDFAESHNIKLLEIWYWDFDNIENILQKYIPIKYAS